MGLTIIIGADEIFMNSIESKKIKETLISNLTEALPVLRASIGISQEEIAKYIGVSRQTYCAMEQKKRTMSWNTFLSLILLFYVNDNSKKVLESRKKFLDCVYMFLQYPRTEV